MARQYLKTSEVKTEYGIGRRAINTLVRNRQLKRKKVGHAFRYSIEELEKVFSPRKPNFVK